MTNLFQVRVAENRQLSDLAAIHKIVLSYAELDAVPICFLQLTPKNRFAATIRKQTPNIMTDFIIHKLREWWTKAPAITSVDPTTGAIPIPAPLIDTTFNSYIGTSTSIDPFRPRTANRNSPARALPNQKR